MKKRAYNWEMKASTVISITLVLLLLGLLLTVEYHSYRATHDAQERITYKVDLVTDITEEQAIVISDSIAALPYVKHVDYISKEEAAEIFSEEMGEDFVGFIGYNPLYPSLMVNFNANRLPDNSSDLLDEFTQQLSEQELVTGVVYQENVVNQLNKLFYNVTWFLILFVALLLVICILMIRSTIRLSLYTQRETIHTMRMVGATNGFVARPFVRKSLLQGLLGGVFADLLLLMTLAIINKQFELQLFQPEQRVWYGIIGLVTLMVGMIISVLATWVAVGKYLRVED